MFNRTNFGVLRKAIDDITKNDEDELLAGLKQNYLYLIKRSAKVLICLNLEANDDDESKEVERFVRVLGTMGGSHIL